MTATTISECLAYAKAELMQSETAVLDALILLGHCLNKPRHYLYAYPEEKISTEAGALFTTLLKRRKQGEPIAYLTQQKEFWSLSLRITPDTLIPRPETELLVETLLSLFPADQPITIADLGTGSGAIALAIAKERPNWTIYATDISEKALRVASENAKTLKLARQIHFMQGSWCEALPKAIQLEAIVSNPPYLSQKEWPEYAENLQYEPQNALISGVSGFEAYQEICKRAPFYLKPGGYLLLEHGYNQEKLLKKYLIFEGYKEILTLPDLSLQPRLTICQRR